MFDIHARVDYRGNIENLTEKTHKSKKENIIGTVALETPSIFVINCYFIFLLNY